MPKSGFAAFQKKTIFELERMKFLLALPKKPKEISRHLGKNKKKEKIAEINPLKDISLKFLPQTMSDDD